MYFLTFIFRNVVRRPLRSALTIFAIAVAVGAVVALVGVANGFVRSFLQIYTREGVDLIVLRSGVAQRANSSLAESLGDQIRGLSEVSDVIPGLLDVVSLPKDDVQMVIVNGWVPESSVFNHLDMVDGRKLLRTDTGVVILGKILADNTGKKVGDTIEIIEDMPFKVVGIYTTNNVYEDGALVITLPDLQRIMDRKGQVTGFSVKTTDSSNTAVVDKVRKEIEALGPGITAMPTREQVETLTEIRVARAMAWVTSAVALLIGTVGIMNTMVMSVSERTREIGVLRAIGWRRSRVMRLILYEAVVLSMIGALMGTLGALALVRFLTSLPTVSGFIAWQVQWDVILQGFVIAVLVGLLGGLVPAIRAVRMLPTGALRHE